MFSHLPVNRFHYAAVPIKVEDDQLSRALPQRFRKNGGRSRVGHPEFSVRGYLNRCDVLKGLAVAHSVHGDVGERTQLWRWPRGRALQLETREE
jgi:hypothetical protein